MRDGADGVRHEVDRHDVIAAAGVCGQLAREVAVDERVEHEHAPVAGVALVHGAVLVDELFDLLERAHLRQHLDDGVRDAELGGGRTGHRLGRQTHRVADHVDRRQLGGASVGDEFVHGLLRALGHLAEVGHVGEHGDETVEQA